MAGVPVTWWAARKAFAHAPETGLALTAMLLAGLEAVALAGAAVYFCFSGWSQ